MGCSLPAMGCLVPPLSSWVQSALWETRAAKAHLAAERWAHTHVVGQRSMAILVKVHGCLSSRNSFSIKTIKMLAYSYKKKQNGFHQHVLLHFALYLG